MIVDIHHHFIPPFYVEALERSGIGTSALPAWSPERSLAMMRERGIDKALLSLSSPGAWLGDDAEARRLARSCNDYAASLAREHAPRFGALAALPIPDVAGAVEELRRALDTLKLDGVLLFSNVGGTYVGDPDLDPVLAELDRRSALVLLHAGDVPADDENAPLFPGPEYPIDVARAYARLVLHDGFLRFPRIRWVLADSGGALPFLAQRLSRAHYTDGDKLRWGRIAKDLVLNRNGGLDPAQHVDYDATATADPVVRAALDRLVPRERIRFGSNFPFDEGSAG
jgi:predicted TIM-barrel fold metal-dependent hydrolase